MGWARDGLEIECGTSAWDHDVRVRNERAPVMPGIDYRADRRRITDHDEMAFPTIGFCSERRPWVASAHSSPRMGLRFHRGPL